MFKVGEILKATGEKLIQGNKDCHFLGISIDSRTIRPGELFLAIKGNNFDGHNFINEAIRKSARGIVISRNKSFSAAKNLVIIRVKDTTKALGDIARYNRERFNIPLVAITGSNGKTTTKEMLAFVLEKRFKVLKAMATFNNQIGVPLTLLKLRRSHEIVVLELGTNHFGEIDYLSKICQPNIAIITNIAPSHLEFFKNLNNVFKEKYSLIRNLKQEKVAIVNGDDRYLNRLNQYPNPKMVIKFGINNKSDFKAENIELINEKIRFYLNGKISIDLNTIAKHNVYNCLAAIACCKYFHLDYNCIQDSLKEFSFPSGRLEVKNFKNIKVIDDTYNANPLSFKNAIDALSSLDSLGRKVLIFADMLELGCDADKLHFLSGKYAADSGIDILIGVGNLTKHFLSGARKAGMSKKSIFHFKSSQAAKREISKIIRAKDLVLVKGSRLMQMEKVVQALKSSGV
ncbi:MAG: UDP-N-acetylmuramoyl-tripeptide--D-alanyl-D-alanine ligase [Candidatus Omnitrophota bacterium]|nr:UDP-N-acetylmuramoyl-tripeptide--D-alanyl-D-alanine ligase [Candidatus Omnitrophota bacterium]